MWTSPCKHPDQEDYQQAEKDSNPICQDKKQQDKQADHRKSNPHRENEELSTTEECRTQKQKETDEGQIRAKRGK